MNMVIPFVRPIPRDALRHVSLLRLDGTLFAQMGYLPGADAEAAWQWIRTTVARELSCSVDQIGYLDDADVVTVDDLPVYNVCIEPQRIWVNGDYCVVMGEWEEAGQLGFDYQIPGDVQVHWIRAGDARLGRQVRPNYLC